MKKLALLLVLLLPGTAPAPDVYKGFLNESLPHHRAIKETLALIEKNPGDGALHNDLGCLIAWDGFWRDALREFDRAAELSGKDSRPLFNAGVVQAWRGEWSSARSSFKKALDRDPGNWAAWWMLGYAEERLDNIDAAVDAYKRSLRVDTSLFDIRRNPFAATTKLKGRVLLETYSTRMIRATMPQAEQFEDPERIGSFFQRSRAAAPPGAAPEAAAAPSAAGPVMTSVPPVSAPSTPRTASPAPAPTAPSAPVSTPAPSAPAAPVVAPAPPREVAPAPAPPPAGQPVRRIPASPPGPGAPVAPTPNPPGT